MSKPDTWMPWYIGDYLADTMHLTRDQHGGYDLLLMAYWRNGGPLEDDDAMLAAIAKATPAEWRKLRPVLVRFFRVADGRWHQKRADTELAAATALRDRRMAASERANAAKKKANVSDTESGSVKTAAPGAESDTVTVTVPVSHADPPSPSPSPSEAKASGGKPPNGRSDPVKALFDFGVSVLTESGVREQSARSEIGKWRKVLKDDGKLMSLLVSAQQNHAIEPLAYLEKAVASAQLKSKYGLGYVPPGVGG